MDQDQELTQSSGESSFVTKSQRAAELPSKDVLEAEKLSLEVAQLQYQISWFGRWSKIATALIATGTAAVALFSGLYQLSRGITEARSARISKENAQISESFDLLMSDSNKDVAKGALGLLQFVDDPTRKETIYESLKTRLSVLQTQPPPKDVGTRPDALRFEQGQIRVIQPLIRRFHESKQRVLYQTIFENANLKYARLLALEELGDDKVLWEDALKSGDDGVVAAVVSALDRRNAPFAEKLLIDTLLRKNYVIVTTAAATALGKRKTEEAVPHLIKLLSSHENKYVRIAAAEALGDIGNPTVIHRLDSILAREKEAEARRAIENALRQLRSDK